MNPDRLVRMSPMELAGRARQEASKWVERLGLDGPDTWPDDALRAHLCRNGASPLSRTLENFRRTGPARFFRGATDELLDAALRRVCPHAVTDTLQTAAAIRQGHFDLLGYHGLDFGDPVDWHLDPVSGRRSPRLHWSRLDPLDASTIGDCKIVWELNRHQWLVRLGQAYRLTGDEQFALAFMEYVDGWMRANPPRVGINWTSSLEVALRLISWCWGFVLLRGSPAWTPESLLHILAGIWAHATHIARYLSSYSSPNTHLTGEALGLFYAGVLFTELPSASRWRRLAVRILHDELERQVHPDGVHFEQSTCYQRYTVETYLHFLILASRNGIPVSHTVRTRLQAMLDFILALRRPDGSVPQVGDADGGCLLPLAGRHPDDAAHLFATAAALFGRSDYAWAAGDVAPEMLWLLGAESCIAFRGLRPSMPRAAPSRLFPAGGYVVMRNGWGPRAHQLIFDVGPLGCPVSAGHGHADLLSIQCAAFGQAHIVDPGTYCYARESGWRDYFRGTAAHSTVMIDGIGHASPTGPFRWQSRPVARLQRWYSGDTVDFADASHQAYCRLPDPVVHRRRVLFIKPRYWIVADDLLGAAEHAVELRFQFDPIEVGLLSADWARARRPEGQGLLIRSFASIPLKVEVHEGCVAPPRGWVAPHYGQRRPAPVLTYSAVTRLPLRIVTLLVPREDSVAPPPPVAVLASDVAGPTALLLEESGERVRFDPNSFSVERA